MTLEVSPAGSDRVLGSATFANLDSTLDVGTEVITLPASGSYTVRVRAAEERTGGTVPSEYRFQVRREPCEKGQMEPDDLTSSIPVPSPPASSTKLARLQRTPRRGPTPLIAFDWKRGRFSPLTT